MGHSSYATLAARGGDIKSLGSRRVGGFLVMFTSEDDPDLTGEYFTKDTDFGPFRQSVALYGHGLDPVLKHRSLDDNAALEVRDAGVWIEAQLQQRDAYEEHILHLVEAGKLGWSSGTAEHLVQKTRKGSASRIDRWPLGLDASVTPVPAEPRTRVVPVKSIALPNFFEHQTAADTLKSMNRLFEEEQQTISTLRNLNRRLTTHA